MSLVNTSHGFIKITLSTEQSHRRVFMKSHNNNNNNNSSIRRVLGRTFTSHSQLVHIMDDVLNALHEFPKHRDTVIRVQMELTFIHAPTGPQSITTSQQCSLLRARQMFAQCQQQLNQGALYPIQNNTETCYRVMHNWIQTLGQTTATTTTVSQKSNKMVKHTTSSSKRCIIQ